MPGASSLLQRNDFTSKTKKGNVYIEKYKRLRVLGEMMAYKIQGRDIDKG